MADDTNFIDKDDEEHSGSTSAYINVTIDNSILRAVVDTGAGRTIMTKACMDLLDWNIEKPSKLTLVTADGKVLTPLGEIHNIPIKLGEATFCTSAVVTHGGDFDVILGNEFLKSISAVINVSEETMAFRYKGKSFEMNLNMHRADRVRNTKVEELHHLYQQGVKALWIGIDGVSQRNALS